MPHCPFCKERHSMSVFVLTDADYFKHSSFDDPPYIATEPEIRVDPRQTCECHGCGARKPLGQFMDPEGWEEKQTGEDVCA